jgi:hypothetical protein
MPPGSGINVPSPRVLASETGQRVIGHVTSQAGESTASFCSINPKRSTVPDAVAFMSGARVFAPELMAA